MDGRLKIPPCVLQDIGHLGPLPKKGGGKNGRKRGRKRGSKRGEEAGYGEPR